MADEESPARRGVGLLALGALGVVFGDIGTSPLYAVRQILHDAPRFATDQAAILGCLSLILWSVALVVCVKYLGLVMRADHDGEGGTLAMLGLIHSRVDPGQDQTREDARTPGDAAPVPPAARPGPEDASPGATARNDPAQGDSAASGPASRSPEPGTQASGGAPSGGPPSGGPPSGGPPSGGPPSGGPPSGGPPSGGPPSGGPLSGELPGALTLLVLFASALLFGDGMVTPAISVLSAMEGLDVATTALHRLVLPLAVVILLGLFALQRSGAEKVGRLFGPVMLVWFGAIGLVGLLATLRHPEVLAALDPLQGLRFLGGHGWVGYATLGSVVLAFSGAEALFADLGQFGRRPIALSWYCVVLPGLGLNYLGQGAVLMADPKAAGNPFFALLPHWGVIPMVMLSALAAVIASQALISGAFSLTQQAVSMGYAPRYTIVHTSASERGQVYMPTINAVLMLGCIGIVLGFRSSDALGGAYGLAVIGTMTITSVVFYVVMRRVWGWGRALAVPVAGCFLVVELAFLGANLAKILTGAWLPLAIALLVYAVMATWTRGRARYHTALAEWSMPLASFRAGMAGWPQRRAGTAVFLTDDLERVPLVGRHTWLREQVDYEQVLLLRVSTRRVPFVPASARLQVEDLGDGLHRATATYGFMQLPQVGLDLPGSLPFTMRAAIFFLPEPLLTSQGRWRERVRRQAFLFLGRTGLSPVAFFRIPPGQAVMVGMELEV